HLAGQWSYSADVDRSLGRVAEESIYFQAILIGVDFSVIALSEVHCCPQEFMIDGVALTDPAV
ncbi:hypothetical protein QEK70_001444, partial [Stenotrophomonas maltophilia]|nr:hypothetical protein [Stenotrophomonas maltophilia]